MLGSTVINHRQHVGLQKLSALAGVTLSFLGPNKKYKFIQDEASGESALVCSCLRVLENLELTCSVGQLVFQTIQAHHRVYHTGSGCLLFLAGAWSRAALECLQRGIPIPHIISAMSEGMDLCLDVCKKSCISTEGLGVAGTTQASPHSSGQRRIKLSRHFSEMADHQPQHPDITHMAAGLSHGCDTVMNLVLEVSQIQSKNNQPDDGFSTLDVSKVVTCVLPGLPEERACVLPGCVVLLSAEQTKVAHQFKDQHLKVVLIHGDLAETYRHLGFKRPAGVQRVGDQPRSDRKEEWTTKVVSVLLKLEVKLVLVSGLVSEQVLQRCCRHHILVVEKVKASVMTALADATGALPVTYATQLSKSCVGAGVKAAVWRELSSSGRTSAAAVNISTDRNSRLVTVILSSCVPGKLQALEDQFWACAYRLHHGLRDKALLPGAGVTEMLCVQQLQKRVELHLRQQSRAGRATNPHSGLVLQLMADGLIDFTSTVLVNSGSWSQLRARAAVTQQLLEHNHTAGAAAKFSHLLCEGEQSDGAAVKTYDNLSVKQEAWRKALDLVLLVLQADAEIITGIEQRAEQEHLMLL